MNEFEDVKLITTMVDTFLITGKKAAENEDCHGLPPSDWQHTAVQKRRKRVTRSELEMVMQPAATTTVDEPIIPGLKNISLENDEKQMETTKSQGCPYCDFSAIFIQDISIHIHRMHSKRVPYTPWI